MVDEAPHIEWDMDKIHDLKQQYDENMQLIKEMLPDINWDSPKAVKNYFNKVLEIPIENGRIEHLSGFLTQYDHDSEEYDTLNGYLMYLKLKWAVMNYLDCIIRHQENGRVYLRHHQGKWVLPNKRPLSGSPEIMECIVRSEGV